MFDYARALSPNGMYVTTGGNIGRILQIALFGWFFSKIYKKKMQLVILKPNKDLAYINQLFEKGKIKPVIDGPYKLEDVPAAFMHFGKGQHKGKVIINI